LLKCLIFCKDKIHKFCVSSSAGVCSVVALPAKFCRAAQRDALGKILFIFAIFSAFFLSSAHHPNAKPVLRPRIDFSGIASFHQKQRNVTFVLCQF
jgi:hypothetical protein